MPSVFKQAARTSIGTTRTEVLSIQNGIRATIIGFNVANVTDYDVIAITVTLRDTANNETVYIKNLPIAPYSSVKLVTNGEKLIIPAGHKVDVTCNVENSADVVISYVELS